jgi:hypothetical protein
MTTLCYSPVVVLGDLIMAPMILCSGCQQLLAEEAFAVDRMRASGRRYKCRACSSLEFARWKATPGYRARLDKQLAKNRALKLMRPRERWVRHALNASRRRSKTKGLAFGLTLEWLQANTPSCCPLLGMPLAYDNDTPQSNSAALDRIDNSKGYEPDNCWVISMLANRIKTNATLEQLEVLTANLRRLMMDKGLPLAVQAQPAPREPTPPRTVVNPYAA